MSVKRTEPVYQILADGREIGELTYEELRKAKKGFKRYQCPHCSRDFYDKDGYVGHLEQVSLEAHTVADEVDSEIDNLERGGE